MPSAVNVRIDGIARRAGHVPVGRGAAPRCSRPVGQREPTIIAYCTIGGRACTAWFALTYLLGRDNVRVYDGSWAEWGRIGNTPVEVSASVGTHCHPWTAAIG